MFKTKNDDAYIGSVVSRNQYAQKSEDFWHAENAEHFRANNSSLG